MRKRLLITYICLTLILVLSSIYFMYNKGQSVFIEGQKKQMVGEVTLLADILNTMPLEQGLEIVYDYDKQLDVRISLISGVTSEYGKVLVDTQYNEDIMGNHQYREEVKLALAGDIGYSIRKSNTLNIDFLYVAVPVTIHDQAMVLRVAEPLDDVQLLSQHLKKIGLLGIVIALGLAIVIYYWSLRRLTKPLDEITDGVLAVTSGDYDVKLPGYEDQQFNHLSSSFNQMVKTQKHYINGLEIKNSEMEALFNSVDSGIALLDSEQSIKVHNKLFAQLLELDKLDLVGMKFYEIFRKTELIEQVEAALVSKTYETQEILFNLQEDNYIYNISTVPVVNSEKNVYYGLLLVIEDITQIKSLENMRKDFVANVSHELKTPLTSIRGFIDTLKNGALEEPEVAGKFLNIIDLEADRLYRLIQQLLYLSQLENAERSGPVVFISLNELAEEMQLRFAKQLEEKQIQLVCSLPDQGEYQGDIDAVRQILINIIDNAIKYSKADTISLTFTFENKRMKMVIKDNGIGLSVSDQKRIFERFYRVEKSRAQKNGGTGLGLAIVKHLVENCHGHIEVVSQLGSGTEFQISLP